MMLPKKHALGRLAACAATLMLGASSSADPQQALTGGVVLPDALSRLVSQGFTGFPSNDVTIEMWVRGDGDPVNGMLSFGSEGHAFNEVLLFDMNDLQIWVAGVSVPPLGVDVDALNPGGWNHLAITRRMSDGRFDVFVNGQPEANGFVAPGESLATDGCLVLGEDQDSLCGGFQASQAFLGAYRELRIWGVRRTQAEIASDLSRPLVGDEPGLVVYWPFDEQAGSTATDLVSGQTFDLQANAGFLPVNEGPFTCFTYSGLLSRDGEPADGTADIVFHLFDSDDGAGPPLASVPLYSVSINGGVFSASPPFETVLFDNTPRWLGLEVRFPGEPGFSPVAGLQPIGSAAGAIEAATTRDPSLPGPGSIWTYRDDATVLLTDAARLGIGDAAPGARVSVFAFNEPASSFSGTAAAGLFMSSGQSPIGIEAINNGTGQAIAIRGSASSSTGTGVIGVATDNDSTNFGVYGQTLSPTGFGVYSNGRLGASGTKSFVIDHPLDPAEALLYHYSTEGPSPQNAYNGIATLDDQGRAWVTLPDYFERINIDPRYQLTPIGAPAQVYISSEIDRGVFQIAGGKPGMRVSWQVKADRADRFVLRYGAPTETDKAAPGEYLRPELIESTDDR